MSGEQLTSPESGLDDFDPAACLAELADQDREFYGILGLSPEEGQYLGMCANLAGDDEEWSIALAVDPTLKAITAEESGAPEEDRDPATWRRRAVAAHGAKLPAPRPSAPRTKGTRRQHRARSGKSTAGRDDGDDGPGEPPADPVQAAIDRIVAAAPPLSPGQVRRLSTLLGSAW